MLARALCCYLSLPTRVCLGEADFLVKLFDNQTCCRHLVTEQSTYALPGNEVHENGEPSRVLNH
jgi:hypothetical protein